MWIMNTETGTSVQGSSQRPPETTDGSAQIPTERRSASQNFPVGQRTHLVLPWAPTGTEMNWRGGSTLPHLISLVPV